MRRLYICNIFCHLFNGIRIFMLKNMNFHIFYEVKIVHVALTMISLCSRHGFCLDYMCLICSINYIAQYIYMYIYIYGTKERNPRTYAILSNTDIFMKQISEMNRFLHIFVQQVTYLVVTRISQYYICNSAELQVHCSDIIISGTTSQIADVLKVCSTVCSDQRNHQYPASLAGDPPVTYGFP